MNADLVFYQNQKIWVDGCDYIVIGGIEFYNRSDGSRWTEYRLKSQDSTKERWLSIDNNYGEYSIFTQYPYQSDFEKAQIERNGFRESDSGRACVTSFFGSVDVNVNDCVDYMEYEDAQEEQIIAVERWEEETEYSKGYYLDADEIRSVDSPASKNQQEEAKGYPQVPKRKRKIWPFLIPLAVVLLAVIFFMAFRSDEKIKKFLSSNSAFTYTTSITSDINPKEKADVYQTPLSVDLAVRTILDGIDGKTEEVQQNEEDSSTALLTKEEYCLVYTSEEGTTMVQISSRAFAYQSRTAPYHSTYASHHYYRRFYYTWGYGYDRSRYKKYTSGYENYADGTLNRSTSDPYRTYSNSLRQGSTASRKSSGGGTSSGK